MFIPLVRLAFAKCFMNVASTRSMSRTTCHNQGSRKDKSQNREFAKDTLQIGSKSH